MRNPSESRTSSPQRRKKRSKSQIVLNPRILGGEPFIQGTRIPISIILTHIASGDDDDTILENFPKLKKEDIEACREYTKKRSTENNNT